MCARQNSAKAPSQRNLTDSIGEANPTYTPSLVPTYFELFRSGETIELVYEHSNGLVQLHFSDGKQATISPQIEFDGRTFCPAKLSPSIRKIVTLPTKSADFHSTTRLFQRTQDLFASKGFAAVTALAVTYFVFATWFADVLPFAPCLFITGSRLEADNLLQLLSLVVRHPLPIGEFNRRVLASLPMGLQPTMLINPMSTRDPSLELLRLSNRHRAFLSVKNELIDIFAAKAGYLERIDNAFIHEIALQVHLSASGPGLFRGGRNENESISRNLQAQFLAYRSRHILTVQASQFDLTKFTSNTRMLARILGAPIVDAPALQAGLESLMKEHEEVDLAFLLTDLRCAVIEATLHHIHKEPGKRVHVGDIAQTTMAIFKGRGNSTQYDPREIGTIVRSLGLIPKRDGQGYAVLLDATVCNEIHDLAHRVGLLANRNGKAQCERCKAISDGFKS